MNRLKGLRDYTQQRDFKVFRRANEVFPLMTFKREHLSLQKRCAKMLEALTREEQPVVFPEEKIAFLRTVQDVPPYFDGADIDAAYAPYPGDVYMLINNICVDYHILLDRGLQSIKEEISQWLADATDAQRDFGESVIICIDSILALAARYAAEAERVGNRLPSCSTASLDIRPVISTRRCSLCASFPPCFISQTITRSVSAVSISICSHFTREI